MKKVAHFFLGHFRPKMYEICDFCDLPFFKADFCILTLNVAGIYIKRSYPTSNKIIMLHKNFWGNFPPQKKNLFKICDFCDLPITKSDIWP